MAIYIYGLVCPIAGVVRYVGKSVKPKSRLRAHIHGAVREAYDHHTSRWLRKLKADGLEPALVVLHEVGEGERWQDVERGFIATAAERGWNLTNSTAGGEGLDYIDPVAKAEYAAKMSAVMKVLWNTPERRAEAQARIRKLYADPEMARLKAEAVAAAQRRPEVRAKVGAASQRTNARPEVRASKSAKIKALWDSPEGRAMMEAARGEDTRAKMSASAKARYADPEKGAKARAEASDPAKRAKLSAAAQRRSTPEYRAMMAARTAASWLKRKGQSP